MRVHAFIISWTGQEENARRIAEAIASHVDELTVVYSNHAGQGERGAGDWHRVDDAWFYGKKFAACLKLHRSGVMLQIQADVVFDDWPRVVARCRHAHRTVPDLGVWAPYFDNTPWRQEIVLISALSDASLSVVANTDGLVWALSEPVADRMRELDYDGNNLGWGIDWAAICFALANRRMVVRDTSLVLTHPPGTGYSREEASAQMSAFLQQLPWPEKIQLQLLDSHVALKTALLRRSG
jgi:hypothetical protein